MNKKTNWAPLLLAIAALIFYTSWQQQHTSVEQTSTYDLGEMADAAAQKQAALIESNKKNTREDLIRMYAGGLIFEDYFDVKQRLDLELEKKMNAELAAKSTIPTFVKCDNEYYNDSLKKAKKENWSIEKILEKGGKHIRVARYTIYEFDSNWQPMWDYGISNLKKLNALGYDKVYFSVDTCSIEALKKKPLTGWMQTEGLPYSMDPFYLKNVEWDGLKDHIGTWVDRPDQKVICEGLKKRFNETFEYVSGRSENKDKGANSTCAPVRDPSLKFENDGYVDSKKDLYMRDNRYLTVLAQKYMSEQVMKIIADENATAHLVQFTVPNSTAQGYKNSHAYNTGGIRTEADKLKFLNDGASSEAYDVNLIYLKTSDEKVNFKQLLSVARKVKALIVKRGFEGPSDTIQNPEDYRIKIIISVYNTNKEHVPVIKELFKRNYLTESIFEEWVTMANMYEHMDYTRRETDAFHYLDCFATQVGPQWYLNGAWSKMSQKEFEKRHPIPQF